MKKIKSIILLAISLLTIYNCDDDTKIENKNISNQINIQKISLNELKQDKLIFNEIYDNLDINANKLSRRGGVENKIVLLTNKILRADKNGIKSYSFILNKPTSSNTDVENLTILKYPNGKIKYVLLGYKLNGKKIQKNNVYVRSFSRSSLQVPKGRGNEGGDRGLPFKYDPCIKVDIEECKSGGDTYHYAHGCGSGTGTPSITLDFSDCFSNDEINFPKSNLNFEIPVRSNSSSAKGGGGSTSRPKKYDTPALAPVLCRHAKHTNNSCSDLDYFELKSELNIKDQKTIIFLDQNTNFTTKVLSFLKKNNKTQEARQFCLEAIKAKKENPNTEIDFKKRIINRLKGKAKCIYKKLITSSEFENIIKKFDGDFSVANLKFEMKDLGNNKRGVTKYPKKIYPDKTSINFEYLIKIRLNNNSSDAGVNQRPNLLVAKTIAHEVFHAEISRELIRIVSSYDVTLHKKELDKKKIAKALKAYNYGDILKYYSAAKKWQHNLIVDKYKKTLEKILKVYDGGKHSDQFYSDIAWEGLNKSGSDTELATKWKKISTKEKNRINKVIKNYTKKHKNEKCN